MTSRLMLDEMYPPLLAGMLCEQGCQTIAAGRLPGPDEVAWLS